MIGNKVKRLPQPVLCERIKWVDAAKAVGLFLVFWGHALYGGSDVAKVINRAIYSFHMPMYFILSGYVLRPESKSFQEFVCKKCKRLLLPTLVLYILTIPMYFHPHYLDYSTASIFSILERIFYIRGQCAFNDPIWFFICMFQILLVVKLLNLSNASNMKVAVMSVICILLSYVIYEYDMKIFSLFGFNKCVLGLFFYTFGIMIRRFKYENNALFSCLLALPLWIIFGVYLNIKCSMYGMKLGNFWYFIISGIMGSIFFFFVVEKLKHMTGLCKYAKWTVFIVGTHYLLVTIFHVVALALSIKGSYFFDLASLVFVFISLYGYKYVCLFVEKRLPTLIGE